MSGTSLDGVDLAYVTFNFEGSWQYELGICQTFSYEENWLKELKELHLKSRDYINKIDNEYAKYLSNLISLFIKNNSLEVDLICSHGHTILHQPKKGITLQIGNGKIINDFILNLSLILIRSFKDSCSPIKTTFFRFFIVNVLFLIIYIG